jgi:hypothetical protein
MKVGGVFLRNDNQALAAEAQNSQKAAAVFINVSVFIPGDKTEIQRPFGREADTAAACRKTMTNVGYVFESGAAEILHAFDLMKRKSVASHAGNSGMRIGLLSIQIGSES